MFIVVHKADFADLDDDSPREERLLGARSFPETNREKKKRGLSLSYGAQHRLAFNWRNDASSQQHREIILKTFHFAISHKLCNDSFFLCIRSNGLHNFSLLLPRSISSYHYSIFYDIIYRSIMECKSNELYNFRDIIAISRVYKAAINLIAGVDMV